MITAILFLALFAPFDLITNYEVNYVPHDDRATVTLSWNLTLPANQIVVMRGSQVLDSIPGDSTSFSFEEYDLGAFRYTVLWKKWYMIWDWKTKVQAFGRLTWENPVTQFDGVALGIGTDPGFCLAPFDGWIDVGVVEEYHLQDLVNDGLVVPGQPYYASVATYYVGGEEKYPGKWADPVQFIWQEASWSPSNPDAVTDFVLSR